MEIYNNIINNFILKLKNYILLIPTVNNTYLGRDGVDINIKSKNTLNNTYNYIICICDLNNIFTNYIINNKLENILQSRIISIFNKLYNSVEYNINIIYNTYQGRDRVENNIDIIFNLYIKNIYILDNINTIDEQVKNITCIDNPSTQYLEDCKLIIKCSKIIKNIYKNIDIDEMNSGYIFIDYKYLILDIPLYITYKSFYTDKTGWGDDLCIKIYNYTCTYNNIENIKNLIDNIILEHALRINVNVIIKQFIELIKFHNKCDINWINKYIDDDIQVLL